MADRISGANNSVLPIDTQNLLVKPVQKLSTAFNVFSTITTGLSRVSVPTVEADPTAEFVAETAEYNLDEVELGEVVITPRKIGKLTSVSLELSDSSDPAFMNIAGGSLVRAIANSVDNYSFGNQGDTTAAFAGLDNQAAYTFETLTTWDGDDSTQLLHAAIDAIAYSEGFGYSVQHFVMNGEDVRQLSKNVDLNSDPSQPTKRIIHGVPIEVCNSVPVGTVWGVDPAAAAMVLREDSAVELDRSVGFTRDVLFLKGRIRVALGVLDRHGIVRIRSTTA